MEATSGSLAGHVKLNVDGGCFHKSVVYRRGGSGERCQWSSVMALSKKIWVFPDLEIAESLAVLQGIQVYLELECGALGIVEELKMLEDSYAFYGHLIEASRFISENWIFFLCKSY